MELEALHPEVLDQPPGLPHAQLAARRIDARERDCDVAVLRGAFGDFLVRDALQSQAALVVDRENDEPHLPGAVVRCHLGDRRVLRDVLEVPPLCLVELPRRLVGHHPGRYLGVRVDVDCDQLVDVHCPAPR
jgi:hypothetical protein